MHLKTEALAGPKPAKYAQRYSDEEKAHALEAFREFGPCEAARRLGIPPPTLANWARRAGVKYEVPASRVAAVAGLKLKWEERRLAMAEKVGDLAEESLDAARDAVRAGDARTGKDFAATMATAIDKAQLLTGGPTERVGLEERFTDREREIQAAREKAQLDVTSQAALSPARGPLSPSQPPEPVSSTDLAPEPVEGADGTEAAVLPFTGGD